MRQSLVHFLTWIIDVRLMNNRLSRHLFQNLILERYLRERQLRLLLLNLRLAEQSSIHMAWILRYLKETRVGADLVKLRHGGETHAGRAIGTFIAVGVLLYP